MTRLGSLSRGGPTQRRFSKVTIPYEYFTDKSRWYPILALSLEMCGCEFWNSRGGILIILWVACSFLRQQSPTKLYWFRPWNSKIYKHVMARYSAPRFHMETVSTVIRTGRLLKLGERISPRTSVSFHQNTLSTVLLDSSVCQLPFRCCTAAMMPLIRKTVIFKPCCMEKAPLPSVLVSNVNVTNSRACGIGFTSFLYYLS